MKTFDATYTAETLVRFLKTSFEAVGFQHTVIALSGGVDSSTSAALAVMALGKNNVYPLLLPYGKLNGQGVADARLVIQTLGVPEDNVTEKNIQPFVDPIIATDPSMDRLRRGNVMARVRMILLYDSAKKYNALVVGTENKTEHLLGYFTRFGDEASDIEPLRNLYKTQVYALARYLNLPEIILTKAPSAGLWGGQTDEGEFGFTYKEADEILRMVVDEKKSMEEIVAMGIERSVVEKVVKRMKDNAYKHHLPIVHEEKSGGERSS
ncbi:MAG: NAD+ synthase [Patescibacteria group bacterium]